MTEQTQTIPHAILKPTQQNPLIPCTSAFCRSHRVLANYLCVCVCVCARQKLSAAGQLTKSWHVIAEPEARTNSFVGTEEYLAPEVITGVGHGESSWHRPTHKT